MKKLPDGLARWSLRQQRREDFSSKSDEVAGKVFETPVHAKNLRKNSGR